MSKDRVQTDGNKGTISNILDDDKMPVSENGDKVDMICNLIGVPNRLNFSQCFEQEVSFISEEIRKRILQSESIQEQYSLYTDFLKSVSPLQYETLMKALSESEDKGMDIESIIEDVKENGFYLHCPPFYNTLDFWDLGGLYDKYDIRPYRLVYNEKFPLMKGKLLEENKNELEIHTQRGVIVGNMYFIRLKHDSFGKFSARSAGYLNLGAVPSKNNRLFKTSRALYSKTAIRFGEMESVGISVLRDMDEVTRFIAMHSSNEHDRKNTNQALLGVSEKGYNNDSPFDIKKIEKDREHTSRPNESIRAQMRCLGIRLEED